MYVEGINIKKLFKFTRLFFDVYPTKLLFVIDFFIEARPVTVTTIKGKLN